MNPDINNVSKNSVVHTNFKSFAFIVARKEIIVVSSEVRDNGKPVFLSVSAGRLQSGSVAHLFFESNFKMPWRSWQKVTFTFSLSGNVDLVFEFDFII